MEVHGCLTIQTNAWGVPEAGSTQERLAITKEFEQFPVHAKASSTGIDRFM
jgi:hypothetical protein